MSQAYFLQIYRKPLIPSTTNFLGQLTHQSQIFPIQKKNFQNFIFQQIFLGQKLIIPSQIELLYTLESHKVSKLGKFYTTYKPLTSLAPTISNMLVCSQTTQTSSLTPKILMQSLKNFKIKATPSKRYLTGLGLYINPNKLR